MSLRKKTKTAKTKGRHFDTIIQDDLNDTKMYWLTSNSVWLSDGKSLAPIFSVDPVLDEFDNKNLRDIESEIFKENINAQNNLLDALRYGVGFYKMSWRPEIKFAKMDVYGNIMTDRRPNWRDFLKKIPNLEGQIIGGHTIIWGHKVKFQKETYPIRSRYGDVLSENASMRMSCSCGYEVKDILPLVTYTPTDKQGIPIVNRFRERSVDFKKLEKVIEDHIPPPVTITEIEYVYFSDDFLDDMQEGFVAHFLKTVYESGGIIHHDFDTRSFLLVDDNMTEAGIAELKEMLEGHPIDAKKVRVIKSAEKST